MLTRPDIFVVHGALGSAAQMQPVADALMEVGSVHAVELPGHGNTPLGNAPFAMGTFTDALAAAVELRASERRNDALRMHARIDSVAPIVFGYSMGGYIALALEAKHPCTFGGIVTLGTKFLWTPEYAATESVRWDADTIAMKVPKFAGELEERHAAAGGWHSVLANMANMMRELGDSPVLTRSVLASVRVPVCVVSGDHDSTVSYEETREVATWMPHATPLKVLDTPHPIERVQTALIVDLLRKIGGDYL
ncbi:MAG: alpha/beta fold hydrolase [Gemmatimonadaceae bacterium]